MDRASWSVIQSIPANVGAEDSVLCLCEQRICGTLFQLSPTMYRGIFFFVPSSITALRSVSFPFQLRRPGLNFGHVWILFFLSLMSRTKYSKCFIIIFEWTPLGHWHAGESSTVGTAPVLMSSNVFHSLQHALLGLTTAELPSGF